MTDTLTMQPETLAEGELNAEEQESLKVGEELVEQQENLILGKYKNAEELEKAHVELQKKLGEQTKKDEKPEAEAKKDDEEVDEAPATILDRMWDEGTKTNKVSKETLDELAKMSSTDVAKLALQYRQAVEQAQNNNAPQTITAEMAAQLKDVAGGEESYNDMLQWAQNNVNEKEINMFDAVIESGNPLACYFAIQSLAYRYQDASGKEGQMLTGKAPSTAGTKFNSQAEVVRAMSDPRYDEDPAYRQEITQKLARSNIDF